MGLASGANLTRSKDTATAGVRSATTSFPEMASSASNDSAMLALQIANFETAKQAMEKTTLKAKWINSKICLREISLNEYFKSIWHYFGVNSLSGLTAHWCKELNLASLWFSIIDFWPTGHIDWQGKNQFIVGLPWCNMNSKVQISGKSKVLMLKSRIETHFRITNISCHLSSCSGPNYFKVLCKIVLPSKLIDKSIF